MSVVLAVFIGTGWYGREPGFDEPGPVSDPASLLSPRCRPGDGRGSARWVGRNWTNGILTAARRQSS
jgi:hypothetical protein